MITILEGPDCCGKTTLAKHAVFADHMYQHQGPYTGDPLIETLARVKTSPKPVLFDRLHLGERVYGPIYRDHDKLGAIRQRMLERVLLAHRAVVGFAAPPVEDAVRLWRERSERGEEMLTKEEQYRSVYSAFLTLLTELPSIVFDPFSEDPRDIRDRLDGARPFANQGPGIGHFRPDNILIVSEQVDYRDEDATPYPFVGGIQGMWLSQNLERWGVREDDLYWVCAISPDGIVTSAQFVDQLQPRKIVALGKVAAMWCKTRGLDYEEVAHPLYWMKFRREKEYPLKDLLCGS